MDEPPTRRLRLSLDMQADGLGELADAMRHLADRLELDGFEARGITSGGWASGYLKLTCDPTQTGDRYREQMKASSEANRG